MTIGHLMLDLQGTALTQEEHELLRHPQIGGVILFTRNYESPTQLTHLVSEIRRAAGHEILIAVDQEGGRIQRFRDGFSLLPAANTFGVAYDRDPADAKFLAENAGWLMAAELLAHEVDFSFAPVLDLDYRTSQVIGTRSFHHNPHVVADLAQAFCMGMLRAGMAPVGKHFPGHGFVSADSHTHLPVDEREYSDIEDQDLLPFTRLIPHHCLAGVMPAHVWYSHVDEKPAGFSAYWLQDVLRKKLQFKGAIFSDDLAMVAANSIGDFPTRVRQALTAGCDMVLVCNDRVAAIQVLEALGDNIAIESSQRLLKMRGHFHHQHNQLQQTPAWQQAVDVLHKLS